MWYHRFFFILKREKETLNINIIVYTHLTHSENKLMKQIVRN